MGYLASCRFFSRLKFGREFYIYLPFYNFTESTTPGCNCSQNLQWLAQAELVTENSSSIIKRNLQGLRCTYQKMGVQLSENELNKYFHCQFLTLHQLSKESNKVPSGVNKKASPKPSERSKLVIQCLSPCHPKPTGFWSFHYSLPLITKRKIKHYTFQMLRTLERPGEWKLSVKYRIRYGV